MIFFFLPSCFVPLLFCFFLQAKMTATPTTKTIISGERTPPINGNIAATEIKEIKKQTSQRVFLWQKRGDINKSTSLKLVLLYNC